MASSCSGETVQCAASDESNNRTILLEKERATSVNPLLRQVASVLEPLLIQREAVRSVFTYGANESVLTSYLVFTNLRVIVMERDRQAARKVGKTSCYSWGNVLSFAMTETVLGSFNIGDVTNWSGSVCR